MVKRIVLIAVAFGLLLTLLPTATVFAAPPAQGGFWKVVSAYLQLFVDSALRTPAGQVPSGWFVEEVAVSAPGAHYVRSFTYDGGVKVYGAEGWVGGAAFGTSLKLLGGAVVPPGTVERGRQIVQSVGRCRRWLECNGYVRLPRVWNWFDRTGILTTHPEDCAPYRRMPRPPGCTP